MRKISQSYKLYSCVYDFTLYGGSIGSYPSDFYIPINTSVISVVYRIITPCTSLGSAEASLGYTGNLEAFLPQQDLTSNALDVANVVTPAQGYAFPNTGVAQLIFTIAVAALTAGKVVFTVTTFEGDI